MSFLWLDFSPWAEHRHPVLTLWCALNYKNTCYKMGVCKNGLVSITGDSQTLWLTLWCGLDDKTCYLKLKVCTIGYFGYSESDSDFCITNLCSSHNPILKYLYSILQKIHSIWKPRYRRGLPQPGAQIEQVNKQCRNDDLAIFVGDRLEVKEADKDWLESAKTER